MAGFLDQIYAVCPTWLQDIGVSAYGIVWKHRRYGGRFQESVREFTSRESFTTEQWREYQTEQLRLLLRHAAGSIPYYQEAFGSRFRRTCDGGSAADHDGVKNFQLEELTTLPTLSKETFRSRQEQLSDPTVPRRRIHTYLTSGTTGTPLGIQFTSAFHQVWTAAYEVRCRRWAGVDYRMSRAMIGGRMVAPQGNAAPPFWRYNAAERQLYMSAFHISPANAPLYIEAINHYQPDYLVGYASGHFFLARLIVEMNLQVHRPKAVLTSSEKLTEEMRQTIQRAYGCEVFDAYSGVEACCLASECERHRLHLSPDVGIVELLDEDGSPVKPGVPGEIVATGLLNFTQPLIRYRTGDWAVLSDESCPCGRQMPILRELVGRLEDTVVGPDGREMVRFHGLFVGVPHLREGQLIQEEVSRFRLRLAVDPDFGEDQKQVLRTRMAQRLGSVHVEFECVDEIERTSRGKFRAVISKVQRSEAQRHPDEEKSERSSKEADRIRHVYGTYIKSVRSRWNPDNPGNRAILQERRRCIETRLKKHGLFPNKWTRVLDVGCGDGMVLNDFRELGASPGNLFGVDLLPERVEKARAAHPDIHFECANAEELPFPNETFDLVVLYVVFSSILDRQMAANVAHEVQRVLRPGGAIVWYEFRYDNPYDPHVRGIRRAKIKTLFPTLEPQLQRVTLLPPLARRLGALTPLLYPLLSRIPWLRTHYAGLLIKPKRGEAAIDNAAPGDESLGGKIGSGAME